MKFIEAQKGIGGGTTLYANGNIMENNSALTADKLARCYQGIDDIQWNKCENITDGVVVDGVLKSNNEFIETEAPATRAYATIVRYKSLYKNHFADRFDSFYMYQITANSINDFINEKMTSL